jgi:curved DNA-binding protein CbpA
MRVADALAVLGLGPDATDEAVRAAYRELVKQHPPDLDPDGFARLRRAFELAGNPRQRASERVLGPAPLADLDELTEELRRLRRRPLGPDGWLEVLRP